MTQNKNISYNIFPVTLFPDNNNSKNYFTEEERQLINIEISHYESLQAIIIEVLKIVQKRKGWISDSDVVSIAIFLKVSITEVEGIATFYSQIFRQPVGRYVIRFCDSLVCYINGCRDLQLRFENVLNVKQGETTLDKRFTLIPTCCLGRCDQAPVIMIDEDIYSCVSLDSIEKILEQYP